MIPGISFSFPAPFLRRRISYTFGKLAKFFDLVERSITKG